MQKVWFDDVLEETISNLEKVKIRIAGHIQNSEEVIKNINKNINELERLNNVVYAALALAVYTGEKGAKSDIEWDFGPDSFENRERYLNKASAIDFDSEFVKNEYYAALDVAFLEMVNEIPEFEYKDSLELVIKKSSSSLESIWRGYTEQELANNVNDCFDYKILESCDSFEEFAEKYKNETANGIIIPLLDKVNYLINEYGLDFKYVRDKELTMFGEKPQNKEKAITIAR